MTDSGKEIFFCTYAIEKNTDEVYIIEDTAAQKPHSINPIVINEPNIRFYAGAILRSPNKYPLGTLCILDQKPRKITEKEQDLLIKLVKIVEIELNKNSALKKNIYKGKNENLQTKEFIDPIFIVPTDKLVGKFLENEIANNNEDSNIYIALIKIKDYIHSYNHSQYINLIRELVNNLQNKTPFPSLYGIIDDHTLIVVLNTKKQQLSENLVGEYIQNIHKKSQYSFITNEKIKLVVSVLKVEDLYSSIKEYIYLLRITHDKNRSSKENIFIYTENIKKDIQKERLMIEQLENSISKKELSVVIQPKVYLSNKSSKPEIIGGEVLLRWNNDILGNVSPEKFIKIAEENGFINKIGFYLLDVLVDFGDKLKALNLDRKFYISINLSPEQISSNLSFIEQLVKVYKNYHDVFDLILEVTENLYIRNLEVVNKVEEILKKENIILSIDDFGTGYSSLQYISQVIFKEIKVDKIFIDNIDNKANENLISLCLALAKKLNINTVIEGVETKKQLNKLIDLGATCFQGYYFYKPLEVSTFLSFL